MTLDEILAGLDRVRDERAQASVFDAPAAEQAAACEKAAALYDTEADLWGRVHRAPDVPTGAAGDLLVRAAVHLQAHARGNAASWRQIGQA